MAEQIFASIPWLVLLVVFIGEKIQQWLITSALDAALQRAQNGAQPVKPPSAPIPHPTPVPQSDKPATPPVVVDQALVAAVKTFEGFSAKAYGDYKQYSIGYGTRAASPTEVISEAEAEKRLMHELGIALHSVEQFAPNAPIGVKQALVDLTYNVGPIWQTHELGALVKAGSYEEAKAHVLQYNHAGGQVLPALTKRRETEVSWFDHPL